MASDIALSLNAEHVLHSPGHMRRGQEKNGHDYKPAPLIMSATITDLCSEPLFLNSYLSDEEDCSAPESDDMSFSTKTFSNVGGDDSAFDFVTTLPESLAEECSLIKQQYEHARAIRLFAAGRPKLIHIPRTTSAPMLRHPRVTLSRVHDRTSKAFSESINEALAQTQYARSLSRSSSAESNVPSTPLLEQGLRTPTSARTPSTPNTPNYSYHFDPLASPGLTKKSTTTAKGRKAHEELRPKKLQIVKHDTSDPRLGSSALRSAPPTYSYIPSEYSNKSLRSKTATRPNNNDRPFAKNLPDFPIAQPRYSVTPRPFALRMDSFGPIEESRESSQSKRMRIPTMRKVESVMNLRSR
ncbi:hypothetical protein AAFC00_000569 [Neodothiora populina]|uniref:Uncharacterized protein n=1 Tax=Neodothiora populina TaxID=2781224 RepID=A0ABR3PDA4_9PEZI